MFYLAETVGVYRWSAVLIGFVGVMIMLQPNTSEWLLLSAVAVVSYFGQRLNILNAIAVLGTQ